MEFNHKSVLLNEAIDALSVRKNGIYLDATAGGGGHSSKIVEKLDGTGRLIALDRDPDAVTVLRSRFNGNENVTVVNDVFDNVKSVIESNGLTCVDGILADLGVSSHQFDTATRGFSFRYDAPLDMRMNAQGGKTAADIVNSYTQEELERILRLYGEVDASRKLSKLIVQAREKAPILTTADLHEAIQSALPAFASHKELAKIYQAFRIEVNDEMRSLEKFLQGATRSLKSGGRLVVITYHSLEDRMVKNFIKSGNIDGKVEKDTFGRDLSPLKAVTRKPILPSEQEISGNTRARSAKLRVAEKI